jgi:hypothetical protein
MIFCNRYTPNWREDHKNFPTTKAVPENMAHQ